MKEGNLIGILVWIVGIVSALAVGSGMIVPRIMVDGKLIPVLTIPAIPATITVIAGWVVVIGAILSLILAIFKK